jgi:hypothetical protein
MQLFRKTSVRSAYDTYIRETAEGDVTDSRRTEAPKMIAAGAAGHATHDEILEDFVGDPAIFAASVSHLAGASLPLATIESLLETKSMKALRKLAKDFDSTTIETADPALRAFLDEALNLGPDGRAWTMLVAGHLTLLRSDRKIRALIYPNNQKH